MTSGPSGQPHHPPRTQARIATAAPSVRGGGGGGVCWRGGGSTVQQNNSTTAGGTSVLVKVFFAEDQIMFAMRRHANAPTRARPLPAGFVCTTFHSCDGLVKT